MASSVITLHVRSIYSLLLAAALLVAPETTYATGAPFLSREEFDGILTSEAGLEFGGPDDESADTLWNDLVTFELDKFSSLDIQDVTNVAKEQFHCASFVFSIRSDKYGGETTWDLKDDSGNIVNDTNDVPIDVEYVESNPLSAGETRTVEACLPVGRYNFNIFDSYGDGICCKYTDEFGSSYNLTLGGEPLKVGGGMFNYIETTEFVVDETPSIDGKHHPFMACVGNDQPGLERIRILKTLLDDTPLVTICNTPVHTCAFCKAKLAVVEVASEYNIKMLPNSYLTRIREGTFDAILYEDARKFRVDLFPDSPSRDPLDKINSIWSQVVNMIQSTTANGRSLLQESFFRVDSLAEDEMHHAGSKRNLRVDQRRTSTGSLGRALLWSRVVETIGENNQQLTNANLKKATNAEFQQDVEGSLGEGIYGEYKQAMGGRSTPSVPTRSCDEFISQVQLIPHNESQDSFSFQIGFSNANSTLVPATCRLLIVAGMSQIAQVLSISFDPDVSILETHTQWITQSGIPGHRPFFDENLRGKNQVISVADTGIDMDNCYFRDVPGKFFPKDGTVHHDMRKVVQYVPCTKNNDSKDGNGKNGKGGHGTHVAGIIAGQKLSYNGVESSGMADGIAKDAKIAFYDISNDGDPNQPDCCYLPQNFAHLLNKGKSAGAKIHSASWGTSNNGYNDFDRMFDQYVYNNKNFCIVVAAGNRGRGPNSGTVGSPANGKNVIAVGASQSYGNDLFQGLQGMDYLAYFSSRGPSTDGSRIKPEVVAPGFDILSARSLPHQVGECDPIDKTPFPGEAIDGVAYKRGSSMAAPIVSGTAALVRQYFEEGWYPSGRKIPGDAIVPSGALVKAVLLNGAQPLLGVQNQDWSVDPISEYDGNQGFGRINLIHSLALAGQNNIKALVRDRINAPFSIDVTIDTSGRCSASQLSVTLVWTDPPGFPGCAKCVLNDLDLSLTKNDDATIFYPNGRMDRDSDNNVERVRLKVSDQDKVTITVKAYNLITLRQDFAVIATGCLSESSAWN